MQGATRLVLTLLLTLSVFCATAQGEDEATYPDAPHSVSAGLDTGEANPVGEGASIRKDAHDGLDAVLMDISGGTAWARVTFRNVPRDIRGYRRLALRMRGTNSDDTLYVRIRDAEDHVASARAGTLSRAWGDLSLALGDFQADAGFDPTAVASISLVWFKPKKQAAAVALIQLEPGAPGWRHPEEDLARAVFGKRRMNAVKHVTTDHFDIWSDSPRAMRTLPDQLEKALEETSAWLGVPKEGVAQFKLPVYVFKSAKEFRRYCQETLGWTKAQATSASATGSYWSIVMQQQGKKLDELYRRVGKSIFQHTIGVGGGAWLFEGVGEYCVRRSEGKSVTKQSAARIKAGALWTVDQLVGAEQLYTTGTQATYDHRPIYAQAGSVFEYLLESTGAFEHLQDLPENADRILVGLQRLAALRETGQKRIEAVKALLGEDVERRWRAWARDWKGR